MGKPHRKTYFNILLMEVKFGRAHLYVESKNVKLVEIESRMVVTEAGGRSSTNWKRENWSTDRRLQLERRTKFWCSAAQQGDYT